MERLTVLFDPTTKAMQKRLATQVASLSWAYVDQLPEGPRIVFDAVIKEAIVALPYLAAIRVRIVDRHRRWSYTLAAPIHFEHDDDQLRHMRGRTQVLKPVLPLLSKDADILLTCGERPLVSAKWHKLVTEAERRMRG